jgi:predicted ATPase
VASGRGLWVKGELLLLQNKSNAAAAENDFLRSLALARRQGALSLGAADRHEPRPIAPTQNGIDEAPDLLAAVHNHFTEGFGTADLQRAKRLFRRVVLKPDVYRSAASKFFARSYICLRSLTCNRA